MYALDQLVNRRSCKIEHGQTMGLWRMLTTKSILSLSLHAQHGADPKLIQGRPLIWLKLAADKHKRVDLADVQSEETSPLRP